MDENNNFEKFSGGEIEKGAPVPLEQDFEKSFAEGVPEFAGRNEAGIPELGEAGIGSGEFAGDKYGVANPENEYYGEAARDEAEGDEEVKMDAQYDAGIANAAALINYGLNAAARTLGVETVVQKIKGFNASGRTDPIGDLFKELGVDTPAEYQDMREEGEAAKDSENAFREGVNAPSQNKSYEGAFQALDDMKELIGEVEGADPRYERLREGAKAAGKGYFEYAVSNYGTQGLTELFNALASQREQADTKDDAASDNTFDSEVSEGVVDDGTRAELADGILTGPAEDVAIEKELAGPAGDGTIEKELAGPAGDGTIEKELAGPAGERETLNPEILKPEE